MTKFFTNLARISAYCAGGRRLYVRIVWPNSLIRVARAAENGARLEGLAALWSDLYDKQCVDLNAERTALSFRRCR
jgi:hypothetical protein